MDTSAVTDSTSAVDEAVTGFLPTDENYRLTGKLEEQPAEEVKPSLEEAPAASEEAVDEAAPAAEVKGPAQTKTADTSESRWAKLSRENRELREKNARLEGRAEAQVPEKRETKQDPQPVTETKAAKPKVDDVDKATGKPLYKTYDDYLDARDAWLRGDTLREFSETQTKTQREQQAAQANKVITEGWQKKVGEARKSHADFDTVALNPDLPIKQGSVVDAFILDSPHGPEVLYALGHNPEELARISALNPIAQARELVKIESKFSGEAVPEKTSAKPVTQAPRPIHQVSGKGTVAKDSVEQAVEDGDSDTYIREQNARELARRKRK